MLNPYVLISELTDLIPDTKVRVSIRKANKTNNGSEHYNEVSFTIDPNTTRIGQSWSVRRYSVFANLSMINNIDNKYPFEGLHTVSQSMKLGENYEMIRHQSIKNLGDDLAKHIESMEKELKYLYKTLEEFKMNSLVTVRKLRVFDISYPDADLYTDSYRISFPLDERENLIFLDYGSYGLALGKNTDTNVFGECLETGYTHLFFSKSLDTLIDMYRNYRSTKDDLS